MRAGRGAAHLRPIVFLETHAMRGEEGFGVHGIDRQHAIDRGPAAHHPFDEAAGIQHVISAPWRNNADDWMRSVELLAGLVLP